MDFIDIATAIRITNSSDSTVRRWLRSLSSSERQKYVSRQGKKVVVSKPFLLQAFSAEDSVLFSQQQKEVTSSAFSLALQRQQLTEKDKQINRLQDLNDRLLSDLKVKDEDLKAAWSKVLSLQEENKLLLTAGKQDKQPASVVVVLLVVCAFIAVAGVVLAFF